MQVDHIKALANGGNNDISNIQILCAACHGDKAKQEKQMDTLIYFLPNQTLIQ